MSIDVMKQALEALDSDNPDVQLRAATALRAAIEQPELVNQCGETCERAKLCATCARGLDEQPEQEPVAWRYDLKQRGSFEGVSTEYSRIKLSIGDNWTPLYTSPPPQRKPLTDKEIVKITADPCLYIRGGDYRIVIARAIEAAHGIKEQP